MLQDDTLLRANQREIAAKIVDGEAILINLNSGIYYSLGGAGAYVWSMLGAGASVQSMARSIAARWGVAPEDVLPDLRRLAAELVSEGLASAQAEGAGAAGGQAANPDGTFPDAYEAPSLVKYDDMADIFALDPPLPELPPLEEDERS